MNENLETKYFMAESSKSKWASVYYYSPHVPAVAERRGDIFAVISLEAPTSFDADKAGNFLLDYLHETYFESDDESTLVALEKAVLSTKKRLLELMANDEVSIEQGVELNLLAGVVFNNYVYFVSMGDVELFAMRDGEASDLSGVLKDPDGRGEIKVVSTIVQPEDKFLLMTKVAGRQVNNSKIEKMLGDFEVEAFESTKTDNAALTAALLVGYKLVTKPAVAASVIEETEAIKREEIEAEQVVDEDIHDEEAELIMEESVEEDDETNKEQDEEFEEEVLSDQAGEEASERAEIFRRIQGRANQVDLSGAKANLEKIRNSKHSKTFQVVATAALLGAWKYISRGASYFWNDILKMGGGRSLYLKGKGRESVNWRPIIFFVLVFIVGGYLLIGSIAKQREQKRNEAEARLEIESIETGIGELEGRVATLIASSDQMEEKNQALVQLSDYNLKLENMEVEDLQPKIEELRQKTDTLKDKIERRIHIVDPTIVKDLGLESVDPADIYAFNNWVYVAAPESGTIQRFNYDGGNVQRLAGSLNQPNTLTVFEEQEVIFADNDESRALGLITLENSQLDRMPGISKSRLGNVADIDVYRVTDNDVRLYAIRPDTKEVIQMRKGRSSYGLPELRLKKDDFTRLLDLEVNDGKIFVLSEGQGVRRFYADDEYGNIINGLMSGDSWNTATSMDVDARYIYLGDPANKRILVFTKANLSNPDQVDYIAQIDLSAMEESSNIKEVVSDDNGSLFVLLGTKIMKVDLSKLEKFKL